jgi:acetyltransferase-like isoleucine patch superfamily enzyme
MFTKARAAARLWLLNRRAGVRIARPVFISRTSRIELHPDGYSPGGTVAIGPGARISEGVILAPYGGSITIGRDVYLGPYTVLYGHGGLTIGDDVLIAAHVTIIPSNHGFASLAQPIRRQQPSASGIAIGDDVWIGAGARILDGVSIGAGSIVGAGAVVTKSIPPQSIALGVPAKVAGTRQRSADDATKCELAVGLTKE